MLPLLVLLLSAPAASAPELRIEAPPKLAAVRTRIGAIDPQRWADIARLTGADPAGPPIRVVLADAASEWAARTPDWIAGLAVGSDLVVLFPERTPGYPHQSIEDVLRHEIAHALIARSARNRPVPRWFHEGLATAAERPWELQDRTRLIYELVTGPRLTLDQIDALFAGDRDAQTRAYVLSSRFVRDLLDTHGEAVAADILSAVGTGLSFEQAFARATGESLSAAEAAFWEGQRTWTTWFPLATSTTTLWIVIMLLSLWAIRRARRRRAERRERWEAADEVEGTENVEDVEGEEVEETGEVDRVRFKAPDE